MKFSNYSILPSQNLLYYLCYTILQHSQHPNFYFPILLIKIIFLHNKIIYLKITIIYNETHYLFFLSHSFCSRTTTNLLKPPSPQAHYHCTTHTWHHHQEQNHVKKNHQTKPKHPTYASKPKKKKKKPLTEPTEPITMPQPPQLHTDFHHTG